MRILVYGINYYPEKTGIGKYTGEMCEWLALKGHDLRVITGQPYYPEWSIHDGYANVFEQEVVAGVKVFRHPLYVPTKLSGIKRIIHEVSFIFSSLIGWLKLFLTRRVDVVICIAPPFHSGLPGLLYARWKGSKVIYHIQDLQIDASVDLGMIRSKLLIRILKVVERSILLQVDRVSSISHGMIRRLNEKVTDLEVAFLPNWVDTERIRPLSIEQSLRGEWGFDQSDFIVLYSGNLGEKQGLEIILDAASAFYGQKQVHFVICGNGGVKEKLEQAAQARKLRNVTFKALQSRERLPRLLATADVHLVLQRKAAEDLVMPSKLTGILSAGGVPIVACSEGSYLHSVVAQYEFGIIIPPEDSVALIEAICEAQGTDLSTKSTIARSFALDFLEKEKVLIEFEKELKSLCAK